MDSTNAVTMESKISTKFPALASLTPESVSGNVTEMSGTENVTGTPFNYTENVTETPFNYTTINATTYDYAESEATLSTETDGETTAMYDTYSYPEYYDEYMYPGYKFERPVYLVIWEVMVIIVILVNIVVISVLFRRKMRNATNMILAGIAISDSLTGFVTLPTYIMVYQRFDPLPTYGDHPDYHHGMHPNISSNASRPGLKPPWYYHDTPNVQNNIPPDQPSYEYYYDETTKEGPPQHYPQGNDSNVSPTYYYPHGYYANSDPSPQVPPWYEGKQESKQEVPPWYESKYGSQPNSSQSHLPGFGTHPGHFLDSQTQAPVDGYVLTKSLCRGFMISKYFLSQLFHTVSIFLTLLLGIQRFVSVAFPFKSQNLFTLNKTIVCVCVIFVISPVLHCYHLASEKAVDGLCQWELEEKGCKGGCIYLWVIFFVRHFVPCVMLITFTALFIRELHKGEANMRRMDSNASQISRRVLENRRISIIVTLVVIVFLIPEVPYSIFLLYNAINKVVHNGKDINLETNRAIHMSYEILLILSFHANFYIYTLFNRRFRKCLMKTFVQPVRKMIGDPRRLSISRSSSLSQKPVSRKTDVSSFRSGHELKLLKTSRSPSNKSGTLETSRFMESVSADITQTSVNANPELDPLNANV